MNQQFLISTPLAIDIEETTRENPNYRQVVYTGKFQLVIMSLLPGQDIGLEVHEDRDQFFRVESGTGIALIGNVEYELKDGSAVVIPAGYQHNIINTGTEELKVYTIYSKPEHPFNRFQPVKP